MTRSIDTGLLDLLLAGELQTAEILWLRARDGTIATFTTDNAPSTRDLGLGEATFSEGMTLGALTLASGFEASSGEVTGGLGGQMTRIAVDGGKWDNAQARLALIIPGEPGFIPLLGGRVAEPRTEGIGWTLEIRNAARIFNDVQGRVLTPYCSATFGISSTGCPVVRTPTPCTVVEVIDDFRFRVDIGGDWVDDWFNLGAAAFLSGGLAGSADALVFDYDGATGAVELFESLAAAPQVGDTLNLYRGCSKLLKSDNPVLPTCLTYGAVADFRGWPEVPGSRFYHKVSAPGASYA